MITIEAPPKDQEKFNALGMELIMSGKELGINLDPEGFMLAWMGGVRVLIERNDEGKIISMLLLAAGERWTHSDVKATILANEGNQDKMFEFAKTIAIAAGAETLIYEELIPLEKTEEYTRTVVRETRLT